MKIGILGGSFNPPHKMHKKIALELIAKKYVDKVIFVPTGDAYPKPNLVSAKERCEMVKRMIRGNHHLEVSDFECKNGRKYTYETICYFKDKYKEDTIYFIVGLDNVKELPTWKNYQFLLAFPFIALDRGQEKVEDFVKKKNYTNIIVAPIVTEDISSTQIRKCIKNNKPYIQYIDPSVYEYIEEHNLYQ